MPGNQKALDEAIEKIRKVIEKEKAIVTTRREKLTEEEISEMEQQLRKK